MFSTKRRIPTLDELAKGLFGNTRAILERAKRRRLDCWNTTRGYSPNRLGRMVAEYSMDDLFHPEKSKYLQKGQDKHERRKNLWAFLKRWPEHQIVPKL